MAFVWRVAVGRADMMSAPKVHIIMEVEIS